MLLRKCPSSPLPSVLLSRRSALVLSLVVASPVRAQRRRVLKLAVLGSGILIADGSLVTLKDLESQVATLKQEQGVVWYYRENPRTEAPPNAVEALKLVVKYGVPISFSSDPDYSDEIDAEGHSRPRIP